MFVAASARFTTLRKVLAHARLNPGQLNVGTISPGSRQHLSAKLFETMAGAELLVVPYKSTPAVLTAVLTALRSGEIDIAFEIAGPKLPQLQAGAVKVLAVSSARRNPAQPGATRRCPNCRRCSRPVWRATTWHAGTRWPHPQAHRRRCWSGWPAPRMRPWRHPNCRRG